MLDIRKDEGPQSKIYFSHSVLPNYIDPKNTSTKKKPFSAFVAQPFTHTLDLILPEEIFELVRSQLEDASVGQVQYARVYMNLGELLEGDFFTDYIKMGNIMMLSEGRPLVDNVFSLYDGVLRLELDRPTYERCGLQGKPIEDGGRKHQKARWLIEYDLRATSALHGKKGFSRLEWACKNVLNQSLTWLFHNFNPSSGESLREGKEAISKHHPFVNAAVPQILSPQRILCPALTVSNLPEVYSQEESTDLLEWLHLLSLGSPRVTAGDRIDSYLSRYEVNDSGNGRTAVNLMRVRWIGFIPPQFSKDIYLMLRKYGLRVPKEEQDNEGGTTNPEEGRWFAMTAKSFEGYGGCYTVMQFAGRGTLTWECD